MSSNFWLTEDRFNKISLLLRNKPRGVPRVDGRPVLSGIVFYLRRGYRRSDVPSEYDPAKTLYNRYKRRSRPVFSKGFPRRLPALVSRP